MRVLITGGYGFIGSHILDMLQKLNAKTFVFDNLSSSIIRFKKNTVFYKVNISKNYFLKNIKIKNIDLIVHLAGQTSGERSFSLPEEDINNNILGTLNIIKWAKINNVSNIIFSSSVVVYGNKKNYAKKIKEVDKCNPQTIYGLSKLYSLEKLELGL